MNKTQRKKAVAIAKDVIKQIKNLQVVTGSYCVIPSGTFGIQNKGESLQDFIPTLLENKECRVCALGACFISHVKLYNHFDVSFSLANGVTNEVDSDEMFALLVKSLGAKNMALIETAFERYDRTDDHLEKRLGVYRPIGDPKREKYLPYSQILAAITFGQNYEDEDKRLAAIMRNVIRNDGEFVVTPNKTQLEIASQRRREYKRTEENF